LATGADGARRHSAKREAQLYKGRTITMIVNYPAGGPTDIEGASSASTPAHHSRQPDHRDQECRRRRRPHRQHQLGGSAAHGDTIRPSSPST